MTFPTTSRWTPRRVSILAARWIAECRRDHASQELGDLLSYDHLMAALNAPDKTPTQSVDDLMAAIDSEGSRPAPTSADELAAAQRSHRAFERLAALVETSPLTAWSAILSVLEQDPEGHTLPVLAAGPMEELLAQHGPRLIDRIAREADTNARLTHLLGGVWPSSILPEVWRRIEALRQEPW